MPKVDKEFYDQVMEVWRARGQQVLASLAVNEPDKFFTLVAKVNGADAPDPAAADPATVLAQAFERLEQQRKAGG